MSDKKSDILVLGATGFTGGLITRYLSAHPQRTQFSLALGARSPQKLKALVEQLSLPSSVKLVQVDVTNESDVERAILSTRVVINTVGPYWTWGTPVVRACVKNGVHYVDLTGETFWTREIIKLFDYAATKTGAIIVPSCGFDSVPSDISAHLSNQTLKLFSPPGSEYLEAGESTSALGFRGGISGGTISTFITALETVPHKIMEEASQPYSLSPFTGLTRPPQLIYNFAIPGSKPLIGAFFVFGPGNRAVVQRTYGLLELHAKSASDVEEAQKRRYGPRFNYDEFMITKSKFSSLVTTVVLMFGLGLLLFPPTRWLVKKILPKSGEGPSDQRMEAGWFTCTNLTVSDSSSPVRVKTVMKGRGDPGYLSTAIMISESALSLLLPFASESRNYIPKYGINNNVPNLPALAQIGGVLTPMTAFGDVLIQRLEESGRFEFSSSVVGDSDTKKTI